MDKKMCEVSTTIDESNVTWHYIVNNKKKNNINCLTCPL